MYLSQVVLNGLDRRANQLLADPYKLHAALMTGFAAPEGDGPAEERILFRQESAAGSAWIPIIVQSRAAPDWGALHARYQGAVRVQAKEVALELRQDQMLRFRLRANPTVCRNGNRYGLVGEVAQRDWLERRAERCGFRLLDYVVVDEGFSRGYKKAEETGGDDKRRKWHPIGFRAVRYEGKLCVVEPVALIAAIRMGIGPAKGLGCGLLSVGGA